MKLASSTCSALTWLLLGSAAGGAQDGFEIVIRAGDLVQGVGHITSMFDACVDDSVSWLLESETSGSGTSS